MGFPILVRWHLYIESGPRCFVRVANKLYCIQIEQTMAVCHTKNKFRNLFYVVFLYRSMKNAHYVFVVNHSNSHVTWECRAKIDHGGTIFYYFVNNEPAFSPIQCWKLGQLSMPETWQKWLVRTNRSVYYARQTRAIYPVLPYSEDLKVSKCSFISKKGTVNIWNDHKAQK